MDESRHYFGTDGIRGTVGQFPISADFILKLGWAVGTVLAADGLDRVVIGKDTRISGYMLESALEAGLSAAGADSYLLGPMPTAAIAYLTRTLRANIGIVISASHNPFQDNGIKFFGADGFKLSAAYEKAIELQLEKTITTANSSQLGRAKRVDDAIGRYIEFCKSSLPHSTSFKDLTVVVDCANGATYHIAPYVFSELGINIITINDNPDGFNINAESGSNHPHGLKRHVLETRADLGIAFDGDGDRLIMVDHLGEIVDGDEILLIITKGLIASHYFNGGVVGTHMSNLGLQIALEEMNVPFMRVNVGDNNIVVALRERNWLLGGEASGHIVYLHVNTTGDGIIAALQVLQAMQTAQKNLHELKKGMTKLPQKILNVPHNGHKIDLSNPDTINSITQIEKSIGKNGRVLVRHSGTEPYTRIMAEGENEVMVDRVLQSLRDLIYQKINQG